MAKYVRIEVKAESQQEARAKSSAFQGFSPNCVSGPTREGSYYVGGHEEVQLPAHPDIISIWDTNPNPTYLNPDAGPYDTILVLDHWIKRP